MVAAKLPSVSVVITCYNCELYIAEAMESVARQTYRNIDVVVIDDASTDRTVERIRETLARLGDPRFRFFQLEANRGQTGAARRGLAEVKSPFVCFVDADDVWHDCFVERHLAAHLNTDFPVGFTYCDCHFIDHKSELLTGTAWWFEHPKDDPPHRPIDPGKLPVIDAARGVAEYPVNPVVVLHADWSPTWACNSMASMMFRRDLVEVVFPKSDEQLPLYLDYYLATFCILVAGSIAIHEPLYAYRMHGNNSHSNNVVAGGAFSTSRNDWRSISRRVLELVLVEMPLRQAEITALVGDGRYEYALYSLTSGLAEVDRVLSKDVQIPPGGLRARLEDFLTRCRRGRWGRWRHRSRRIF